MATLDIFNDDAFSVSSLTETIVDIPRVSTPLGDSGLFTEYGIATTTMMIERKGKELSLVPAAPRGGVRQPVNVSGRSMIPVAAVHLPQGGSVLADEVQGIRAFGSETEVESVQNLVREKMSIMKEQLDLTMEYHRIGAIKGQILDADGESVLLDLYDLFDVEQETIFFNFASSTSDIKQITVSVKRAIQKSLGGRAFTGVIVECSRSFFDALTSHATVKKAFELYNQNSYARTDQSGTDFVYAGVTFREYAGGVGEHDFIPEGEAYAYPTGVSRLFVTAFAPADYMETVNTQGLPYYAKQERMPFNKGVELESQSNPINLCKLPEVIKKLSVNSGS